MKAKVERDLCVGCGLCPELCPEVFRLDAENVAVVHAEEVPAEAEDSCRSAAEQCPTNAISLDDH